MAVAPQKNEVQLYRSRLKVLRRIRSLKEQVPKRGFLMLFTLKKPLFSKSVNSIALNNHDR